MRLCDDRVLGSHVISFPSLCFTDFTSGFTHTLFKNRTQIHSSHFEVLSCASAILHFSGPTVIRLFGSSGAILSWLLLITIKCCYCFYAGIWASGFGIIVVILGLVFVLWEFHS